MLLKEGLNTLNLNPFPRMICFVFDPKPLEGFLKDFFKFLPLS